MAYDLINRFCDLIQELDEGVYSCSNAIMYADVWTRLIDKEIPKEDFAELILNLRQFTCSDQNTPHLSPVQKKALKHKCPHCHTGKLREVSGNDDDMENYL